MNTLRVFFAIIPPKKIQTQLSHHLKRLRYAIPSNYIRWIDVKKMHVTLQFLGNVPQDQLMILAETVHVALKNISPFQLEFGHLEWFPTAYHPKVLSLSVKSQDLLAALSDIIGQALIALNYPRESRPFLGHLSMGRVIKHDNLYELLTKIDVPTVQPFMVHKIYLIESKFAKGGQRYFPLAEFQLA